jgi:hypothetical protein
MPRAPDTRGINAISALGGALLLLAASAFAARWGVANAIATDAWSLRTEWQEKFVRSGELPTRNQQQALLAELNSARSFDVRHPQLMEQTGAVLMMPVAVTEAELVAAPSALSPQQAAIDAYAGAVVARPVSGFAWTSLALAKYQAGQIDKELYRAIANAAQLAPWEPPVQLAVTDLGFALWDEMPAALRPVVMQTAANARQHYADKVFGIAERRGRMQLACGFPAATESAADNRNDNKLETKAWQLARAEKCQ